MAWENLSADLSELFQEFTTHADAMCEALEIRLAQSRKWHRDYNKLPHRRKALNAQARHRYRTDEQTRQRVIAGVTKRYRESGKFKGRTERTRMNALAAWQLVSQGMTKEKAIKTARSSWWSMSKYRPDTQVKTQGRTEERKAA